MGAGKTECVALLNELFIIKIVKLAFAGQWLGVSGMSTSTRKIRWGVLGYARIARESVIPALTRSTNSIFHAIASRETAT